MRDQTARGAGGATGAQGGSGGLSRRGVLRAGPAGYTLVDWTAGQNPAPGVVDTPCVGGQWKPDPECGWSMEVVDNTLMPEVPLTGTLEPTSK